MPILPIPSLAQLTQLGAAAESVGSAVSANITGFLQALTDQLSSGSESKPANAAAPGASQAGPVQSKSVAGGDLAVIQRQLEKLIQEFRLELQNVLLDGDTDSSTPFSVALDEFGRLRASDEHPDAQQINNLIEDNEPLAALFRAIEARYRLVSEDPDESADEGAVQPFSLKIGA